MFGKPARETPKPETTPAIPELKLPENLVLDSNSQEAKSLAKTTQDSLKVAKSKMETENSELVNNVEKISRVVSPYFIAIAGLSLYKDNFFLGTVLIGVGILSLLKVSAKDVALFLEWLKNFLGFSDEEN
jgi:hypothetical protein